MVAMKPVYLDNAATTPLAPEVRTAMLAHYQDEFGNPSSRHPLGVRAAEARDRARRQIARAVDAEPENVIFTSGGTESNNLAVLGRARASKTRGRHILIGPTEHPSVRAAALALVDEGFDVEFGRLDANGAIDIADLEAKLRSDTAFVAVMAANNELGSIYPTRLIGQRIRACSPDAHFHVDAVQALGKLDVALTELGADSVALSAHKVHGPKGTGALVFARTPELRPLVFGGGQESGRRSGTEDVAGIVGFGLAAELADREREASTERACAAREVLRRGLESIAGAQLLEPGGTTLPTIAAVKIPGVPAEVRMHHLEARGVYVSAGSACNAGKSDVSPVLAALGLDAEDARRVLRFSFSRMTTIAEVERAVQALADVERTLESVTP